MDAKTTQGQKLEKRTNRAWRIFWFMFFLVVMPAAVGFLSYILSNYLSRNPYFATNFTLIVTLASFFVGYKLFDKYLEKPILKNNASNASFRVHASFFFSLVALTSAFVILIFTEEQQLFKPLPLIALGVVYSFTWLYCRWKPIDQVDSTNKAFKHAATLEEAAKCFHNLVVFFHLAFQFAMIYFYMSNPLLWGGLGIPVNVAFWIVGIKITAQTRKQLQEGLLAGGNVKVIFLTFKKQFAQVMVAASASFMIIIIFYPLIADPSGLFAHISLMMLFVYGLVLTGVLLVKAETYTGIYFRKQIAAATGNEQPLKGAALGEGSQGSQDVVTTKLNKISAYATAVLIGTSLVMGFVPGIPAVTPITVVAVYAMVLGERKSKLTEGWWYSLSHLANTICLLASLSFGVLPSLPFFKVPIIVQATVFIVALYMTVEGYCAAKYFKKHRISGLLDAMAVGSFTLVGFSCYEILLDVYTRAAGITSIVGIGISGAFIAMLLSGIVVLLACYRLYRTRGHVRTNRRVKVAFSVVFAWVATAITALVMLDEHHLITTDPVNLIGWTAMWWAGSFVLYVASNCLPGIYFQRDTVDAAYRACIVYIACIPALVFYNFPTVAPVLAATIGLTITAGYHVKWGVSLHKVAATVHERYLRVARPLLVGQMLAMQLGWFIAAGLDLMLAAYIAVVVTAVIGTICMRTDFFKRKTAEVLDVVALFYTSVMIFNGLLGVTWGTPYVYLIPMLVAALFAFIPFLLMHFFGWIKTSFSRIAFANSLLITALLLALPTAIMIGVEERFHLPFSISADLFYTLLLALGVFSAFNGALTGLKVKPSYIRPFKWGIACAMAGISVFGAISLYDVASRVASPVLLPAMASMAFAVFFAMNFITLAIIHGNQLASKHSATAGARIGYFGLVISVSLFLTQLIQLAYPASAFPVDLGIIGGAWHVLFFALFGLILSSIPRLASPVIKLHVIERVFTTGCWLLLDAFGCLYITGFLDTGTLLSTGTLFTMLLVCTAPATRYFLRQSGMKPSPREREAGTLSKYAFLAASILFLLDRSRSGVFDPASGVNPLLYVMLLLNVACYGLLFARMIGSRGTRFSSMMACSLVLVLALAFLPTYGGIPCALVAFGVTAKVGSTDEKTRWIRTALLSTVLFSVIAWFHGPPPAGLIQATMVQIHFIEYNACLFTAIVYAIATTEGKKSLVEGNVASVLGSLLVFQLLVAFTTTSIFHSGNITLIVYLSLMAAYFNKAGSARKFTALKALGLSIVIYLTTGICSLVFNKPGLDDMNATMTFLATYMAVAFIIIRFFRPFMLKYRRQALAPMLAAFNVFVPVFLYLVFAYYAVVPVEQPILVLLCADIGFFLCFLSIGIYRWNLTKDVWKVGWWLWVTFPWLNFYLVFKAVQGVDVIDGLNFFSLGDLPGSGIITIIMVTAMYLPIIWYKVKKYYYTLMLAIWGESLLLVGWVMQNVFAGNAPLTTMGFFVFGTGLLLPLLYKWHSWRAMAAAWAFLAASNILFLHFLLMETGIPIGFVFSIELIVTSVLGMLYSAIPKSPARWHVLVTSYTCLLAGMWAIVYFTMYEVTRHAFISTNIAFIAIAFSLFSSRFLKVNQVKTRALIALILMVNLSLLAFNTLAMIPELILLATFVGITVFGGSFYTINQYKMIFHVDKHIPWSILGIGSALSASSLVVSAWQAPPMIVGFVFSLTTAFFFYKDFPIQVKAAFIPLPPTFLAEQLVVTLVPGQAIVATILFSTCYLALFQAVVNAGVRMAAGKPQGVDTSKMAALLPRINLAIFVANAVQLSTVVAVLLEAPAVLTLLLPFLLICCQSYATRTGIVGKQPRAAAWMTTGSIVLHALIAASIMVLLPIPALSTPLPPEMASIIAKATVFSTSMFIQLSFLDMRMFKIMVARVRFVIMLCTYALAFNIIATYMFLNHGDPSLFALSMCALNVITTQLWQLAFPARKALAGALKKALYNGILISASSLAARWITFDPLMALDPTGLASWLVYFTCTFLFLVLLNLLLNKTLPRRANLVYQILLYVAFQAFLSLSWIRLLPALGPVGLVSISGLALVETALAFLPFHFIRHGLLQRAKSFAAYSPLALLVYFEVSLMAYAGSALVLGTVESLLLALGCMFVLSIVEFHAVKCVKPAITWALNLASYIPLMLAVLLTWTGHLPVAGSIGLVSLLGLALVETNLAFYVFHVVRHRLVKRAMARQPFAWLVLPVYVELSLLAYAASALVIGLMESALVGFMAMFLLTLVEIHAVKCVKPVVGYALNLASFLPLMAAFALAWIGEFPASPAGTGLVSIAVLVFLETVLALYPFHVVRHRLLSRPVQRPAFVVPALLIYFELSFVTYASAELLLGTMGSVLAALGCLFLLTLADVHGFKYLRPGIGYGLNLASYLPFMAAFALSWIEPFPLGLAGAGLVSLAVLAFLETVLALYPFHVVRHQLLKRAARREAFGSMAALIYIEISLVAYAVASLALGVVEGMTCAFACLFVLANIESYGVKCVKVTVARLLVIAGWLSFTVSGLILVSAATVGSRGLYMVTLAVFTALQQYTVSVLFPMLKASYPSRDQQLGKARQVARRSIGLVFYLFVFLALQAFVSGAGLGSISQALAISFGVFVISLIDRGGLDYFGKRAATVMIEVCWILFSAALTSGAVWFFGSTPALIPIIGLGVDLEIAAAVGFLKDFGSKDYGVRSKIAYRILIVCQYIIFSTWPNFLWVHEPLANTSLVLGSMLLFELFLRGDVKGAKAMPAKATQLLVRGFDIGICCWLAVLSFQGLQSIPGSYPAVSAVLSAVVGIVLLYIPLQPFKRGGLLKTVYWSAFSIACGTLTSVSSYYFTFVPTYVHFLFGGLVFFLLFRVVLERKNRSASGKFMLNLLYYAVIYATVTGILFGFMHVTLIITLLAVIIFGAILSGMVYFYERRGAISMKWRLFTSITLISLIFAFIVLVILWAANVPLPPGIIIW